MENPIKKTLPIRQMKLEAFTRTLRARRYQAQASLDRRLAAIAAALVAMAVPAESALLTHLPLDTSDGVTLNGDAAITTGGQGKFGEALTLDGTGDWADVAANNPVTGGAVRTVSAWVFQVAPPTVANKTATVIGIGTNNTTPGGQKWDFEIDNALGGIEVGVGGGRNAGTGLTESELTGNWMLLVSTLPVAGGTVGDVKTYWNGALTNASTGTKVIDTVGTRFDLGVSANGSLATQPQHLNGRIDDVAIWSEALTADEIKGLYDVGNAGGLSYTASDFDPLKQVHDAAGGSATVGSVEWTYASGLTGSAGLSGGSGSFTLVLDATAGTGLTGIPFVERPFAITSITAVGGGIWELTLIGDPDTRYEFRSSADLDFTPGTLIQGLVQGNPGTDAGTISGPNNQFITTDENGGAVVRVALGGPRNFVRAQDGQAVAKFDFEADGQGFTPTGDWAWGVAASDNGLPGGNVTGGNGSESGHCWATVLGDGGTAINGSITPGVDSILTSPDINLTGVAGARLQFAAAVDAATGNTLEVRVRDAGDNTLLDTITPFATFPATAIWQALDFALPATADGNTIYLEFRYQGASASFLGFYLDDVTITY